MISTPTLTLPPGWVWAFPDSMTTSTGWPFRRQRRDEPVLDAVEGLRSQTAGYLTGAGVVAAATFTLAVPGADQAVLAWLVLAWARPPAGADDPLTVLATSNAHDVASIAVDPFTSLAGCGVRAVSVHDPQELADESGDRPWALTARYVLPWDTTAAFVAQFSTLSLTYGDELGDMFDAIVAGVRREP